jgi:hypothetical protein
VAVVHHDGGGGSHFRRGSSLVVVGSDEGGGVLRPFGPERKTTERGPRVSERGWGGLAGPAKGRGPVVGGGGGPMGGERGVSRLGWKERWIAAGPNPESGQNSKINSFRISIDFRIWQNFEKLYKES